MKHCARTYVFRKAAPDAPVAAVPEWDGGHYDNRETLSTGKGLKLHD